MADSDDLLGQFLGGRAPRVWGLPPGADFPVCVANGLVAAASGKAPEALAHMQVIVNSGRMRRRMGAAFERHAPLLLPRIGVVEAPAGGRAPGPTPLRQRLELARLVRALLVREPDLAPDAAVFDLASSLTRLLDEMREEGVAPAALERVDAGEHASHWERSLRFLRIVGALAEDGSGGGLRALVDAQCAAWAAAPPQHPVFVVGSTGSRGPTADLIAAAARLPAGGVVLPGFDFDQPDYVWQSLFDAGPEGEDHPQYRIARLLQRLGLAPTDVAPWPGAAAPSPERNRLVSLALRPAPVTDQWREDGRALTTLADATSGMVLIEAPSPRIEAVAIALRLRQAVEDGQRVALVTPDRRLTRRVTAALGRWGIEPDDSAGRPLAQTAPGRLLRHVAALAGRPMTAEALLVLLKHPLVHAEGRGDHLRATRELELRLRRRGPAFPTPEALRDIGAGPWTDWVCRYAFVPDGGDEEPLGDRARRMVAAAEALAAGSQAGGSGALWDGEAGRRAQEAVQEIVRESDAGDPLDAREFDALLATQFAAEVREATGPHPDVLIWGTLEARTGAPDLAVLAGLTEGVWPEAPAPDPWLNRRLRGELGLLLPERRIGLAAHDFQQAVAAREVVLSRSVRDAEAETVPARWLNRLVNLLGGLVAQGGPEALAEMRDRGARWVAAARSHGWMAPVSPARRPSPRPPVAQRPRQLSITDISKLVRDPYAIYAARVLGLRRLDPLRAGPDALLRGQVIHLALERFVAEGWEADSARALARLMRTVDEVLENEVPWPVTRRVWRGRLAHVAPWFVAGEAERRARGDPALVEARQSWRIADVDFTLVGRPDRIDLLHGGGAVVYDYKTGSAPTKPQIEHFDRQLLLAAAMVEAGVFAEIGSARVDEVAYLELGRTPRLKCYPLPFADRGVAFDVPGTVAGLARLIGRYDEREKGYTARAAVASTGYGGDFDHLARFGEWADSDDPAPEEVA